MRLYARLFVGQAVLLRAAWPSVNTGANSSHSTTLTLSTEGTTVLNGRCRRVNVVRACASLCLSFSI